MWPGVTEPAVIEAEVRARASADATATGSDRVQYLGSILIPADEVVFFFFAGQSRRSVESVAHNAGLPCERVLESVCRGSR
jgi:hypothetical protein